MKIHLEFDTWEEHEEYIRQRSPDSQRTTGTDTFQPMPLPSIQRKNKAWTQYEIQQVMHYYPTKQIKWIANSLHRTPASVNQLVAKLRKLGAQLPNKRHANGKVTEH